MRLKVGNWVAFESITRDRHIVGKVVEATADHVVVETTDRCAPGESRRITFNDESPWMPSRIRWARRNGHRTWSYVR